VPRSIAGTAGTNSYRRTDRAHAAVRPNSTGGKSRCVSTPGSGTPGSGTPGSTRPEPSMPGQVVLRQHSQDQHGQSQACPVEHTKVRRQGRACPRLLFLAGNAGTGEPWPTNFVHRRYYWNIRNLFGSKSGDAPVGHLRRCREHPLSIPPCPGGKTDVVSAPVVSVPSGAAQGQDRSMITLSGTFKACGSCDQTRG
jgi:hypothetical protein